MKLRDKSKVISDNRTSARRMGLLTAVFLGLTFLAANCHAATFNWPTTPAWPGTGPANGATQTVDYGYSGQGSLRASVFNNGGTYASGYPIVERSADFPGANGGFSGERNLILYMTAAASTSSYQQVTINFMYTGGANNVSFRLYDIDFGGNTTWIDRISNISATAVGGGTLNATSVTGSTANSVTGSGASFAVTGTGSSGDDSSNGNVNISFGSQTVSSITFRWSNAATTTRTTQWIGISPITFTSIGTAFPEVNSSIAALMLCGGLMGLGRFRRRSPMQESSHCPPSA